MSDKGVKLTRGFVKRIAAQLRYDEGRLSDVPGVFRRGDGQPWYFCKLASTCATATFSAPVTCTVNVWQQDQSSGASPQPLIITTDPALLALTVTNFWALGTTAAIGTQAAIEWSSAGWTFRWIDC